MKHWRATLALTAAVALVGCQNKDDNKGVPKHDQQLTGSADTKFEKSEDPPLEANTHFAAGQLAESQGNLPAAGQQYTKALELDKNFSAAMYKLAVVQSRMRQHTAAIATWQRYIEATHQAPAGYSNLGFSYELAGKPAEAETAYRKGISLDPHSKPCRVNYGLMLARAGNIDAAVEQLSAVLSMAQVYYNLASIQEAQGQKDLARAGYKRALDLDPTLRAAQTRLSAMD